MTDLDLTERLDHARSRSRDRHAVADPLLDANDAAAVLKISAYTVRQRARRTEIPAIRLGKFWRFRRSSLVAVLQNPRVFGGFCVLGVVRQRRIAGYAWRQVLARTVGRYGNVLTGTRVEGMRAIRTLSETLAFSVELAVGSITDLMQRRRLPRSGLRTS